MRLQTYVLFVVLLTLLGLCTVHEVAVRTRERYDIARLLAEEERLGQELSTLDAQLGELTSPTHLERLNQDLRLGLVPLKPVAELERVAQLPEPAEAR